ncbi:MAG: T9SS type A sorting domain-containing protein [Bacteroidetes bacterium]|nr:T9SS C-terminal target domain-containing protein [Bacteroidota bacterium]MBV6461286.1 hypothetical protein [Flavobacteriales bacterium]WKZ75314.1 MAG: tail fiber domain-containing protein [Vicingaceae bacterium]MCL4816581.1 T9SS type A sorting domain-containing protein [Flavobacteriales bacterium]NOG94323.1 T9SS type A sorting domain-containing protein [Bacteroidota bacterium]
MWGSSPQGTGNYAIYSDGNLYINGIGTGNNGQFYASDQQFKTNIDTITNASAIISQLAPKSFFYDTLNALNMRFSPKKQYGFIAQDVEQFMPELVGSTTKPAEYDSLGNLLYPAVTFKTMNYNAYFAILTKALQEQSDSIIKINSLNNSQQSSIDSLTTALNNLSQQFTQMKNCLQPLLNFLCGNNNNSKIENLEEVMNIINVELSHGDAIVLEQNVPNPFNENTSINYYIPENTGYAQIIFTDMQGRIIKTVDINQTGHGQLKVYAAHLSQGIYQYSIVVDGKIIDTKKMLVEK